MTPAGRSDWSQSESKLTRLQRKSHQRLQINIFHLLGRVQRRQSHCITAVCLWASAVHAAAGATEGQLGGPGTQNSKQQTIYFVYLCP